MKWGMTSRMIIVFIAGVAVGKWLWRDGAGEDRQVGGAVSVVRDPHAARDGAGAGMGRTATADEWMRSISQQPGGPGTADFLAYLQTLDADGLQALAEEIWLLPDEQISDEAVAHLIESHDPTLLSSQ